MELNLNYNPKNSIVAIFYFIFGSLLIWWSYDKIPAFTSVFSNTLPKIIIWIIFIFLYVLWILIIPYLCLTGKLITPAQFFKTFAYGLIGIVTTVVILPLIQTLMDALSFIFVNAMLSAIAWLVTFIVILYYAFYKPIEALY